MHAFERAEMDGLAPLPQSRSWREWHTIVETYALAGYWKRAFKAADKPPGQSARLDLRLLVLELAHSIGNQD